MQTKVSTKDPARLYPGLAISIKYTLPYCGCCAGGCAGGGCAGYGCAGVGGAYAGGCAGGCDGCACCGSAR